MARFVVVEIPDNDEADAFVKAIEQGTLFFGVSIDSQDNGDGTGEYGYKGLTHAKVPQVYAVPTIFCECPDYKGQSVRSSKYGWWVHVKCAKPRAGALQHPYNLLERNVDARERVYYMGFRADRRGWRIPQELP
jgi:hypothetical protein